MAAQIRDRVFDWLSYYADFDPGRLAAVDLATGRWLGYGEFDERATRLATGLRERFGVRPFDRVAFVARNSTDHFEAMFACWKLGAMFVPLNWRLSPRETAEVLRHCEPRVLLHDAGLEDRLGGDAAPRLQRRPGEDGCEYEALIAAHEPAVRMQDVSFDTPNMLLYTSGTTGRPKGVIYTHRMTHNITVHAALHARVRSGTRTLTYLPLFHAAGLYAVSTPQFHYGGAVMVMREWDAAACLGHLLDPKLAITHVVGVPTSYQQIAELPGFVEARFPALEVAAVGGAPVPLALLETWERKGCELSQSFGMTEAFSVAYCPPEKAHEKIGSAGHALMHIDVRIGDEDGHELPRDSVGEIQVRGPGVTPGYWNDPDATAAAFTHDGWFRTGDAARMTEDGTIYVPHDGGRHDLRGGPHQGHDHLRRREHLPGRGGERHRRPARGQPLRRDRRAGPPVGRGGGGDGPAAARPGAGRGGRTRALPRAARRLQGAAARAVRRAPAARPGRQGDEEGAAPPVPGRGAMKDPR